MHNYKIMNYKLPTVDVPMDVNCFFAHVNCFPAKLSPSLVGRGPRGEVAFIIHN
jgi:hypothetical protein